MLDPNSALPLYRQLADQLLERIQNQEFVPGSKIPSEHELARVYKIGRPTVRQATELLVRERILERQRGSGTFVRDLSGDKPIDLFSLTGTLSAFNQRNLNIEARWIRHVIIERGEVKSNGPQDSAEERSSAFLVDLVTPQSPHPMDLSEVLFLRRLICVDQEPVLVEDIWLDRKTFPGFEKIDLTGQSLSEIILGRYSMKPMQAEQSFQLTILRSDRQQAMEVGPKTQVLLVKRRLDFHREKAAIYSELYCRTDRFVFSQRIGVDGDTKSRLLR